MSSKKISINKVCKLNRETIRSNNQPDYINYLDTGNITRNKIGEIKHLVNGVDKFPSRAQRKVQKNTIIYSTVRPEQEHFGIIENTIDNLIVSTGFTTLDIIDDTIDAKYLYYSLTNKSITEYLSIIAANNVTSYPSLNPSDIGDLVIKIPSSKTEQQKIAKVLSDLDAKIELNNKINDNLEQMAKTLYDYWFAQFDFPDADGKPYKTSGGKMVWNEKLKKKIPEGWEVDTLSNWIGKDKSGDWGKEKNEGNYTEKVYCIRGADLNGLNGNGEVKAPIRYILKKNSNKILDPHDLIVEISGGSPTQSTGRMAYITKETLSRFDAQIICSNFCKAVTLKHEMYLYNFAFEWNKAYDNGILFGYEGKTSGIKNLLFESFVSSYYTPRPPKEFAEKFYAFMESLQSKKQMNLLENQRLSSLRDWLLPMLMNGQVKVNE